MKNSHEWITVGCPRDKKKKTKQNSGESFKKCGSIQPRVFGKQRKSQISICTPKHKLTLMFQQGPALFLQRTKQKYFRFHGTVQSLTPTQFCHFSAEVIISSAQFSHSVVSNSLRPHESLHARLPCPSPTPGVYPNSCPSSQ